MKVRTAELAAVDGHSQDRVFVGSDTVIVLDGASGSDADVSVAEYVEALGRQFVDVIASRPGSTLSDALHAALTATITELGVARGRSPSSTVGIARLSEGRLNVLVLGDTPIYVATSSGVECITDERLANIPANNRRAALERIGSGRGFDVEHRRLLAAMRKEKAPRCNVPGGYWIAEADPRAAYEAVTKSFPAAIDWCVLLTDGVEDPIRHLGITVDHVAHLDEPELAKLLAELHQWEEHEDPHGVKLPRFKRHDDKTIAVITP